MSLRKQAVSELESILETTETPGFKLIMDEYRRMLTHSQATAADHCDTSEKWFQRRGEQAQLRNFLAIRENAEGALEALDDTVFPDEKAPTPTNPLEV